MAIHTVDHHLPFLCLRKVVVKYSMDGGNSFFGNMVFVGSDCVSAKVGLQPPSCVVQNHFMEGADTKGAEEGKNVPGSPSKWKQRQAAGTASHSQLGALSS